MTTGIMFLKMARDEAETLIEYYQMLDDSDATEEQKQVAMEIISDEFNHCLISLIAAAQVLGIHIATDDISPDPNDIEVK